LLRWRTVLPGRALLAFVMVVGLAPIPSDNARLAAPPAAGRRPSAFCHQTDGSYDDCPDGHKEWSDVPFLSFSETHSFLYADQADLDPARHTPNSPVDTLMLMYDECGRTTPLGPNEY